MVWSSRTRHSTAGRSKLSRSGCPALPPPGSGHTAARGVRLLLAPPVPGMRIAGHPDAQRVDRGVRATEQRPQVRPTEREVDGLLRPPDDADAPAVRPHNPNAARPGAINPADAVDLEAVGD